MLALNLKLTPAQVRLLLAFAYGGYEDVDGLKLPKAFALASRNKHWLTTAQALIRNGLISHDNDRNPSWRITDEGIAVAKMIVAQCREIVEQADAPVAESRDAR